MDGVDLVLSRSALFFRLGALIGGGFRHGPGCQLTFLARGCLVRLSRLLGSLRKLSVCTVSQTRGLGNTIGAGVGRDGGA
jgi:hypothetical protein